MLITVENTIQEVKSIVSAGGDVEFTNEATMKFFDIIVAFKAVGKQQSNESKVFAFPYPATDNYIMPSFTNKVKAILKEASAGRKQANIMLTGEAGTGKTEFVYHIFKDCGYDRVYQINGGEELSVDDFFGSVQVRSKDGVSVTEFVAGVAYKALIHGTKVDENGKQVLDENGNPIVIGKPALLFIDEFASILPSVFLQTGNRLLEFGKNKPYRTIEITKNNGEVLKSHPGFTIIMAGNTTGDGTMSTSLAGYTAQNNPMDKSTKNRITSAFHFDYNLNAEKNYLNGVENAENIIKFVDRIRDDFKKGMIQTNLTTRDVIKIAENYHTYKEYGIANPLEEALMDSIGNMLPENDLLHYQNCGREMLQMSNAFATE